MRVIKPQCIAQQLTGTDRDGLSKPAFGAASLADGRVACSAQSNAAPRRSARRPPVHIRRSVQSRLRSDRSLPSRTEWRSSTSSGPPAPRPEPAFGAAGAALQITAPSRTDAHQPLGVFYGRALGSSSHVPLGRRVRCGSLLETPSPLAVAESFPPRVLPSVAGNGGHSAVVAVTRVRHVNWSNT